MESESVAWQATTRGRELRGKRAIVTRSPLFRRAALACCAAAVALVGGGRPVRAADAAAEPDAKLKAEARAHLKRGAELIDAEDLQGALVQFEAAYRLVPNPTILHNFGIVYQGLGRKAAALEAFQRFLDEAARPPAQTREHAEKAVSTLRAEVAELRVQSDVDGATIFVDARKVGETPQRRPIYLDPGPHHLSVEKPGLGTVHAARLQASAGQQLTVPARLAARAPAAAPLPAPAGQVTETQPAPAESARPWQRTAAWVTAGAATAAAGVFVTQLVVRHLRFSDFNGKNCGTKELGNHPQCASLLARGNTAEKWAIVSGVAAAALGAGAAALFLTLPETPVQVSVHASPTDLGLGLQGRF